MIRLRGPMVVEFWLFKSPTKNRLTEKFHKKSRKSKNSQISPPKFKNTEFSKNALRRQIDNKKRRYGDFMIFGYFFKVNFDDLTDFGVAKSPILLPHLVQNWPNNTMRQKNRRLCYAEQGQIVKINFFMKF